MSEKGVASSPKSTDKLSPSIVFEQAIGGARRTLSILKSSDFDSVTGTNETGFKNVVIAALHHFLYDYEGMCECVYVRLFVIQRGCRILSEHEIVVMPNPSLEKAPMLPFLHVEVTDQGKFLLWTFPTTS